ncbi:shikimate kinase [Chitinivorax tropicus]|uniref:Shikimate kinase n=2 Tax=Chitinivorax tropicus TaxID=714531 RepID=A0A840MMQ7_9PROT|nr:shikimate kinase [Chitinivorax tropicus]
MKMAGNIFLVGMMGAGKTSVGRVLAKRLHHEFVDSDHEIEARTGVRIPTIFEIEGEAGFRVREQEVIADLVTHTRIILATGGGAVLKAENRAALRMHGTVIYLSASVDDLLERTQHDKNRPLLRTENPRAKLSTLLAERDPLYREVADLIIDTAHHNVHSLATLIERKLVRLVGKKRDDISNA